MVKKNNKNNKNIKISIICCTLNSEKTMINTLKSIQSQNFEDYEIIIIDGNSFDNTLKIIDSFKFKNISIYQDKDKGVYYAMNKGIEKSQGELVGFLNSDDYFVSENILETIWNSYKFPKVLGVYADIAYVNSSHQQKRYWSSKIIKKNPLHFGWIPCHPTFYCQRKILINVGGFNTIYKLAADYDLMLRILKEYKVENFEYIPKKLVNMTCGGLTNKNAYNIIKQNFEIFFSANSNLGIFPAFLMIFFRFFNKIKQKLIK